MIATNVWHDLTEECFPPGDASIYEHAFLFYSSPSGNPPGPVLCPFIVTNIFPYPEDSGAVRWRSHNGPITSARMLKRHSHFMIVAPPVGGDQ